MREGDSRKHRTDDSHGFGANAAYAIASGKHLFLVVAFFLCSSSCFSQGVITISFDGPPPVNGGIVVQSYTEAGFLFVPLPGYDGFGRQRGGSLSPNNGTAFLQASAGDSLVVTTVNGAAFSLTAVDLAGYSTVVPDFSVPFLGYRSDGTTVSQTFSGSGITFHTFYFGSEFSDLNRVEIPTWAWSLDNLVISVPEPSVQGLGLTVAAAALFYRRLKARKGAYATLRPYRLPAYQRATSCEAEVSLR
jgi:hypothetical protein